MTHGLEVSALPVVAQRIADVRPSALKALRRKAAALRGQGQEIIDLASGNVELPPPGWLKSTLTTSTLAEHGYFEYGDPRGQELLRRAICRHLLRTQGLEYNPDTEVLVTAGASAGLAAALMTLCNTGDCVAIFEPFFENFDNVVRLADGTPKYVPLHEPNYTFDPDELARALSGTTRLLILNSPHNPTGRVFNRQELEIIARLCVEKNITVIADELYGNLVFNGAEHTSIAAYPGMRERTVIVHSWSKLVGAAGWRVGSVTAPAPLCKALQNFSDMALGGTSPHVQLACAAALNRLNDHLRELLPVLAHCEEHLRRALSRFGLVVKPAQGSTFLWADRHQLPFESDEAACDMLLERKGILAVPGSAFLPEHYQLRGGDLSHHLRFCFARSPETIGQAADRLGGQASD